MKNLDSAHFLPLRQVASFGARTRAASRPVSPGCRRLHLHRSEAVRGGNGFDPSAQPGPSNGFVVRPPSRELRMEDRRMEDSDGAAPAILGPPSKPGAVGSFAPSNARWHQRLSATHLPPFQGLSHGRISNSRWVRFAPARAPVSPLPTAHCRLPAQWLRSAPNVWHCRLPTAHSQANGFFPRARPPTLPFDRRQRLTSASPVEPHCRAPHHPVPASPPRRARQNPAGRSDRRALVLHSPP